MIQFKEAPTVHAQGLWDKLNKAVEANPNLDVAGFFLNEIMNEVASDLVYCCYCSETAVKLVCCGTYDGLTQVTSENMYSIAGYYNLNIHQIDELEQAVCDYDESSPKVDSIYDEVESDCMFCVYCASASVKQVCCNAMDGLVPINLTNLYAIADYYNLDVDERNNLIQAVEQELQVA
jgi:hypothetical protein